MTDVKPDHVRAAKYWERAKDLGYAEAKYANKQLPHHVSRRQHT